MPFAIHGIRLSGLLFASASMLLAPQALVDRYLPEAYTQYAPYYVAGFSLVKTVLILGGLLVMILGKPILLTFARQEQSSAAPAYTRSDKLFIGVLFAGAVILRLPGLNSSLMIDEVFLVKAMITQNPVKIFLHPLGSAHILNTLPANLLAMIFPASEITVRFPAFMAGCLSPALLFMAFRNRMGPALASSAGLLLMMAPMHVWFSQQAKGNALLALGVVLSWYALDRLHHAWKARWATVYLLALIACGWAHLSGIFVILGQGVALVITGRLDPLPEEARSTNPGRCQAMRARWLVLHLAAAWATILVYAPISGFLMKQKASVTAEEGGAHFGQLLFDMVQFFGVMDAPAWMNIGLALLVLLGASALIRLNRAFAALLLSPLILSLGITVLSGSFSYARYQYFFMPVYCVCLAAGSMVSGRIILGKSRTLTQVLTPGLTIIMVLFSWGLWHYYSEPRSNYKAVAQWINEHGEGKEVFVIGKDSGGYPALGLSYYLDTFHTQSSIEGLDVKTNQTWLVVMLDPLQSSASFAQQTRHVLDARNPSAEFHCHGELDQYRVQDSRIYELTGTEIHIWQTLSSQNIPTSP
jgi:hypothetical protein